MDRKAAKRQRREKRKASRGHDELVTFVFTDAGLRGLREMALEEGDAERVAWVDAVTAYRATHPNWRTEPASQ